jgi:hypothetical protein
VAENEADLEGKATQYKRPWRLRLQVWNVYREIKPKKEKMQ